MEIRQLKLFCRIVERRSFSLAAEDMHITQPAASLQIRSLERELKTRLLDRSTRDIIATDSGEILYRRARSMLELNERARTEIGNLGELIGGKISVGSSTGPGEHILPELMARFKEHNPAVHISLWVAGTKEVIERVIAREFEVGVVGALAHQREIVVRPLARDEIVVVCSPKHRWASGKTVSFDELLAEPHVLQQQGAGVRSVVEEHLRARSVSLDSLNVALEMGLNESAKHAVMAGGGVTFMSRFAVRTEVEHGTLAIVPVRDFQILRDFYYIHSRHKMLSKAAEAFLAYLGEQYEALI
jgi:DNA-binding transcriptional LysR family regulator